MEGGTGARLAQDRGTGVSQVIRTRIQTLGEGLPRMGVRGARPVEEESSLEDTLEKSVEDSQKAGLGAVQEA